MCRLQAALKHFQNDEVLGFTWASTCSKMRIDEFDGGGVVFAAKNAKWINSHSWMVKEVTRLKAGKNKSKT